MHPPQHPGADLLTGVPNWVGREVPGKRDGHVLPLGPGHLNTTRHELKWRASAN